MITFSTFSRNGLNPSNTGAGAKLVDFIHRHRYLRFGLKGLLLFLLRFTAVLPLHNEGVQP